MLLGSDSDPRPRVKVLDFGIAKMSQESEGSLRTETGAMIGTDQDISGFATEEFVKNQFLPTAKRGPQVSERPWFLHV